MKRVSELFTLIRKGLWKNNYYDKIQLSLLIDLSLSRIPFELLGCE